MIEMKGIKVIKFLAAAVIVFIVVASVYMLVCSSFMAEDELALCYGSVIGDKEGLAKVSLLPVYPTIHWFKTLFLDTPEFFVMFWNSCLYTAGVLAGQVLIGTPAAWAFAKWKSKKKKMLFGIYIVLMVMPFQDLMVSEYLVLHKLSLLDTPWAVILPGVFATLPVFIMTRFFQIIPDSLLEAARIDGASELTIFLKVGVPLGKAGILSIIVLGFIEYWNAIEAPLTFLSNKALWTLSLYIPNINQQQAGNALAASVVMLIPAVLVFMAGRDYLEAGIAQSGLKG